MTDKVRLVPVPSKSMIPERDADKKPVLEVYNLGIEFGGLHAVEDFSIALGKTEISGLIGPNGAGKTTVFNLLTNVYTPTNGAIILDGKNTAGKSTHDVNKMGLARTFQNICLFSDMSVLDNVKVGLHNSIKYSSFEAVFRMPRYFKAEKEANEKAMELLSLFGLQDTAKVKAGNLPYGAQRKLEIARALATDPKVLLLDEPAAGMNPSETADLMHNILNIRDKFGIAVLLIEHDMNFVMGICEGIAVLNFGRIIAKGTPEEIKNNEAGIEAYLGRKDK